MDAIQLLQGSLGQWEGRRWYVYDNGDKTVRYTQFSNELLDREQFRFPEGVSVHHTFKVWNVTEGQLENEMETDLHACKDYVLRAVGYLGETEIQCPVESLGSNLCRMITTYSNGWRHMELFHTLSSDVRARNIRYDGIGCSGTFLEHRVDQFPLVSLDALAQLCKVRES